MIKKSIQKIHQILGSLLSLVFVVWFISGFVMIFEGFPHVSKEFQLQQQKSLASNHEILELPKNKKFKSISLECLNQTSIYQIIDSTGNEFLLNAFTLDTIYGFSRNTLDHIIIDRYKSDFKKKVCLTDFDQWILWSHFNKYFPVYKYYLNNKQHSVIYISAKTGRVIQETTRKQRWAARFGAIPHWFYFKSLRLKKGLWKDVIIWTSIFGCLVCISGVIMGIVRFKKIKKLLHFSPYKKSWYKWHHIVGFVFGLFVFTFTFSGLMSLAKIPEWMIPVNDKTDYRNILFSESVDNSTFQLPLKKALQEENLNNTKKVVWKKFAGQPYYLFYSEDLYNPRIVEANLSDSVGLKKFTKNEVINFLSKNLNIPLVQTHWISESDEYFKFKNKNYDSILKICLNNTDGTILYLDLNNLKLLKVSNKNTRLRRWLYKGLHSFDFSFFEKSRWLRETWLILLSIGGTIVSLTSCVLGYRYLSRKKRRYLRKRI